MARPLVWRAGKSWFLAISAFKVHLKLVFFDDFKLGVLKGDKVVDVSAAVKDIPHTGPHDLINGLIARWDQYKGKLEAAAAA